MPTKETPLIRAVEELGPLPGFLFSSPIMSGFTAIFMCPIFFGFFLMLLSAGYDASVLALFDEFCVGATIGLLFAAVMLFGIAVSAIVHSDEDERRYRRQFVVGGLLSIAFYIAFSHFAVPSVREWIAPLGNNGYAR